MEHTNQANTIAEFTLFAIFQCIQRSLQRKLASILSLARNKQLQTISISIIQNNYLLVPHPNPPPNHAATHAPLAFRVTRPRNPKAAPPRNRDEHGTSMLNMARPPSLTDICTVLDWASLRLDWAFAALRSMRARCMA